MILRYGLRGWSVWIVYVLVGTMQLILIAMGIAFMIRDRNATEKGDDSAIEGDFEVYHAYVRSRAPSTASFAPGTNPVPNERSTLLPRRRTSENR